jgi:NadR type nicotinamide-nucleotide adenylyltransferase
LSDHALVVGKFAPPHRGHQALIDAALASAQHVTVLCWANPDYVDMPSHVRAAWLRELYPQEIYPGLEILVPNDPPPDSAAGDAQCEYVRDSLERLGRRITLVHSSEDYGELLARTLGARHQCFDRERRRVRVSGTAVRADPHAQRELLDPRIYAHFVELVVFLGAESTGKTSLARRMAELTGSTWIAEYGRDYYTSKGGVLEPEDYVHIARRQRDLEDVARAQARRWLFVDTNAITTMHFGFVYGRACSAELERLAADCADRYAYTFVCDDDIPFEQDGWRDNEAWRSRAQGMLLLDLRLRGIRHQVVCGALEERAASVLHCLTSKTYAAEQPRVQNLGPRSHRLGGSAG